MRIENRDRQPDRLISARSEIAKRVELHESIHEGGVARMRHLTDGLSVPGQGEVALVRGGRHLMLMGLVEPLVAGGQFELELQFERAGTVSVAVPVMPLRP